MKSTRNLIGAGMACILLFACKEKKEEPAEKFFPALPFIKSQVAHIDSSLYSIMKIVPVDSVTNDTTYIKREAFKDAAVDFLSLPDISSSKYSDRYTEEKLFEESLNRVMMIYLPVKPDKEEIQREEVLIKPDIEKDKVTTIIINTVIDNRDSLIEKKMLWNVDHSFQVTTTRQVVGGPETTSTYRVVWDEED
jgi:hypothetical protein